VGGFFIFDGLTKISTNSIAAATLCRQFFFAPPGEETMTPNASPGNTVSLNGVELYFEVDGTGEPLLLLSGFSGTSQDWKPSLSQWGPHFQTILPDFRGHGRSSTLLKPFRFDEAASDMFALLDHLRIASSKGVGISAGGNVLLHMATKHPERIQAMVLVSASPYFPPQARHIMREYSMNLPDSEWDRLRKSHPGGDSQIKALLASTAAFADTYDDLNFTPPLLSTIQARTLIVQGDRDPLFPVELSVEMAKAIPQSSLWIIPGGGHGPVIGERWSEFIQASAEFLQG
jgi:pimeloyl-ACP methyl ester carboxylesterase